jgi:hypothetical protein
LEKFHRVERLPSREASQQVIQPVGLRAIILA